jgi:hypothetical protein
MTATENVDRFTRWTERRCVAATRRRKPSVRIVAKNRLTNARFLRHHSTLGSGIGAIQ